MSETSSPAPPKKKTLKEFIDENDKLLTAIGVMGALAALFTTLRNAEYLSFLSFILLIILDFQLIMLIPKARYLSESLAVFQVFFQLFLSAIFIYIIQQYPKYVVYTIPPVDGLLFGIAFTLLKRKYQPIISALVAGSLFAFLLLIYYIAIFVFHFS